MNRGRSLLSVILVLSVLTGHASAQSLDRDSVAKALLEAESQRQSFRIRFEQKFVKGQRPRPVDRIKVTRLVDGWGRLRDEVHLPPTPVVKEPTLRVDTWDGELLIQDFCLEGQIDTARHTVVVTDVGPRVEQFDELETALGLRFVHSRRSVGDVVGDPEVEVHLREVQRGDQRLVEVEIVGPPFTPHARYIHRYDPERTWLLVEWETWVYSLVEGEPLGSGVLQYQEFTRNAAFSEVDGVWMPGLLEARVVFLPESADRTEHETIMLIESVELNPDFDDEDFTLDLASLPDRSEIADARIPVTYRLGEDVVLSDGRLFQLRAPVLNPIKDAAEFHRLFSGSTPITDPAQLVRAPARRSWSSWFRYTGYVMISMGALGALILFFRHRFAAH